MFGITTFRRNDPFNNSLWDVDKLFDQFFDESMVPAVSNRFGTMQVDVKEEEGAYHVIAEMPGVKKEEVKINLEREVLTISVERNEEVNEEKSNYVRRERRFSNMQRSFKLSNIDEESISAKLEDGILTLELPKSKVEKQESRQIAVN